jgi:hypothetical protein
MTPNLDYELNVQWLPTSISWGFPMFRPQYMYRHCCATTRCTLRVSLSFRAECRLQVALKHVTISCTCYSCSTFQIGHKNRPLRIPEGGQHQLACRWLWLEFLQQEMMDAFIACSSGMFLVDSGEPRFYYLWRSIAKSCHLLCDNQSNGRNICLSTCSYTHLSVP